MTETSDFSTIGLVVRAVSSGWIVDVFENDLGDAMSFFGAERVLLLTGITAFGGVFVLIAFATTFFACAKDVCLGLGGMLIAAVALVGSRVKSSSMFLNSSASFLAKRLLALFKSYSIFLPIIPKFLIDSVNFLEIAR